MRHLSLSSKEKKILRRMTLVGSAGHSTQKGKHASGQSGSNVEFKEYRAYASGDELKTIDWKVKAKSDKFFVKTFHEDVNVNGILLLDISFSMGNSFFNEQKQIKFEAAVEYAFILSQLYFLQGESLALYSFADTLETAFKLGSSAKHYQQLHQYFQTAVTREEGTNYIDVMTEVITSIPASSSIILISDLYLEPQEILKFHRLIRAKKCELNIIHVIDPKELSAFLPINRVLLVDAESQKKVLFTNEMAREYSRLVQEHSSEIKKLGRLPGVKVCSLIANNSIFKQFLHFLNH